MGRKKKHNSFQSMVNAYAKDNTKTEDSLSNKKQVNIKNNISNKNQTSTSNKKNTSTNNKKQGNIKNKQNNISNKKTVSTNTNSKKQVNSNNKKVNNEEKIKQENKSIEKPQVIVKENKDSFKDKKNVLSKKNDNKIETLTKENSKSKKKNIWLIIILIIVILLAAGYIYFRYEEKIDIVKKEKMLNDIREHYSSYVKVNEDTDLYSYIDNDYVINGKIGNNQEIILEDMELTYDSMYFKVKFPLENYYIRYDKVSPINELSSIDNRYKKYIPFNENVIISENTSFYDEDDNLVYIINEELSLPIIIKDDDYYGVEFNNRLLKIKKDSVKEVVSSNNTTNKNTSGIAVLNYHFFYDETQASERADCNQEICHSKGQFKRHLEYFKKNNILTVTMEEFELFMNKGINLPKSVLITIDDGWRMYAGVDLLEEYGMNATVFLVTSWFKEIPFFDGRYKYVEFHSHGDDLHNGGVCPGGLGGPIKCLNHEKLLADLKLSREKLHGSTIFCYPFYEYNDYSISVLKEAGFTMAFARGDYRATPNDNKFKIPRFVIGNMTNEYDLARYIG